MSPLPYDLHNSAASSADDLSAKMSGSSLTSNCILLAVVCGLAGLVFSGLVCGVFLYKCRQKNSSLRFKLQTKEADLDDALKVLTTVKSGLEDQRDLLKGQLREVDKRRDANRRNLQAVEQEIREVDFDRREVWLKEKENLLNAQWKLDETKKNSEGQMLFIEKQLETIEIQFTRFKQFEKKYNRGTDEQSQHALIH